MIGQEGVRWEQALKLDDNESIASILLKLEQLRTRQIAVVAPPGLKVFRNPVSMRLLQRKAQDLGIDVTIVSEDELTRQLCAETGFGHYSDVESFRRDDIRRRYHDRPRAIARSPMSNRVSAIGALGIVALVVLVAFVVLPAAAITIVPETAALNVDVPIIADSSAGTVEVAAGRIPAKFMSAEVSGQTTVRATGQRDLPDQAARGLVSFTNQTDQPVTVPKSTIVLAGSLAFATLQDAIVTPSLTIGGTAVQGTGTAQVQAVLPGEDGNVKVGAITAVDGPLGSKVSVKNTASFSGGTKKKQTYLSSDDQAKTKQALLSELQQQVLERIHGQIARNESFVASPDSAGEGAIEELTYEETPEQVTGTTVLHMKVFVKGLTFQGDDVNQVVDQALQDAAAKQGGGARLLDEPFTIQPPSVLDTNGTTARLQAHASARMVPALDRTAISDRVKGLDSGTARAALERISGIHQADVKLWPAWATKVPSLSWRRQVAISSPAS